MPLPNFPLNYHFPPENPPPITEKMRQISRRNSRKAQPSSPAAAIWARSIGEKTRW
jgi:hypothetical protein